MTMRQSLKWLRQLQIRVSVTARPKGSGGVLVGVLSGFSSMQVGSFSVDRGI